MSKRVITAVSAILSLLAVSCNKDVEPQQVQTPITINASYAASGAKVNYVEEGNTISAIWQTGDQLKVVYNGTVNTLTLTEGAGTSSASFSGTITGTPSANSMLICYVSDANNPGAVTVNADGSYVYTSGTFLGQDGTLAGAAKCNLYYGLTQFGDGTDIGCTFNVNTSMMKFSVTVSSLVDVNDGDPAVLTYKSDNVEVAKATFTVGADGENTVYLTIPAGNYSGVQTLVYESGDFTEIHTLSASAAHFVAGQTYSKTLRFGHEAIDLSMLEANTTFIAQDGDILTGIPGKTVTIQIADGATVTLAGVAINANGQSSYTHPGIACLGDATILLQADSVNTVKGVGNRQPGIYVPQNKTLTIDGSGTLNAIASGTDYLYGAGIGGGYGSNFADNMPCGNIVINGGIINATGGFSSAGIGGSLYSACGSITIASTVTSVTATTGSSSDTAPIGKGNSGWPATMTFGNQTMYDNASVMEWPTVEDGQNYGGLTLAISNEGRTWTLTPAN